MSQKPSKIAKELGELKNELGSVLAASKAMGLSKTQGYRYLRLLNLSNDVLKKIDSGELPITSKPKASNIKPITNKVKSELFDILVRTRFATFNQLTRYAKCSDDKARQALTILVRQKLIRKDTEYSPFVYSLSNKGCMVANLNKPKHFVSGSAIHQMLMRNQIEIEMREKNPTAKFITRTAWWKRGLYPAIGEYGIEFFNQKKRGQALVIIDDYNMNPERVPHSLNRPHDVDKSYVGGELVLSWADIVDTLIIYSMTDSQKKAHKKYYEKNKAEYKLTPIMRVIKPIWSTV